MSTEDSSPRYKRMRRRCVDHHRALHSIQQAHRYVTKILKNWGKLDADLASALHASSVVAYAKPFSRTETNKSGDKKFQYPIRDLKREPEFDQELHSHLITMRNELIAHGDYMVLPSTMFFRSIGDNHQLPVAVGINIKRLMGIERRGLAERYAKHFSTCVNRISRQLTNEFAGLARHLRDNPGDFISTANLPVGREVPESKSFRPTGPAGNVKEPDFPPSLAGYKYELSTYQRVLIKSGTYRVLINGVWKEATFEVGKTDIGP
jgi:hypothetical protein